MTPAGVPTAQPEVRLRPSGDDDMRFDRRAGVVLLAGGLGALQAPTLSAQTPETEQELRRRIDRLDREVRELKERLAQPAAQVPASEAAAPDRIDAIDQQVRILGRKQELAEEAAANRAKEAPTVFAGKDGFGFRSADGAFRLRFGGVVHADARAYFTNEYPGAAQDAFVLRRVRPVIQGTFNERFGFLIRPEFGNGATPSLLDAYIDLDFVPQFRVRGGKFKGPVGLERLQSPADMAFVERAFPTQLLPNRDLGVQVHGDVLDGRLNYAAGFFDGVRDGASLDTDTNSSKDFEGRLFAHPFRQSDNDALRGLGLGIAFTSGSQSGTAVAGNLSSYLTPGQQSFFAYNTGTFAAGGRQRWSPQFYWYAGPLGVMGEYARVSHEVSRGANHGDVTHTAWQLYTTWVITGEDAGYIRPTPRQNFDWQRGTWGAFEIGLRASGLSIDDAAFQGAASTRFADPSVSARAATDIGLTLNWYLNKNIRLQTSFDQTRFEGGATGGRDLPTEKVLFSRMQAAF